MKSRLVIGCKTCLEEVKGKRGYTINSEGLLRTPLIVHTAYTVHDLYELFFEHYICPYCNNKLHIEPEIMLFANDFIDRNYHIILNPDYIEIINDQDTLIFREKEIQNPKFVKDKITKQDYKESPTPEEIQIIFQAKNKIDLKKWFFYIESGTTREPYFIKYQSN